MEKQERFLQKLLAENKDRRNSDTPLRGERRTHSFSSPEKTTEASITRIQEKGKPPINPALLTKLDQLSRAYHEESDAFRKGVLLYHLEQLEYEIQRHAWGGI